MLYIDGQIFQTSTWDRGMGKYSLELIKEVLSHDDFHKQDVTFVFNSNIDLSEDRKEHISKLSDRIIYKFISLKQRSSHGKISSVIDQNKKMLSSLKINEHDIFLIPSIFENEVVSAFPDTAKKVAILYDLIPHIYYDRYLKPNPHSRDNYYGRFSVLLEADILVSISETTRNDAMLHLGLPGELIVNIDGARIALTDKEEKPEYVPSKKFILCPTGDDLRKNNLRTVEAFEKFNAQNDNEFTLIMTSNFSQGSKSLLQKMSKNIFFVGNVSQESLNWYYKNSTCVLFVPEYEGLGLPVLEAVHHGVPIVCSDISVFRELVADYKKSFLLVDPSEPTKIASALFSAIGLKVDTRAYKKIQERYTWKRSGKKLVKSFQSLVPTISGSRSRVAIIGPKIGGKSAIGNVMEISHYAISQIADVDYFFEIPAPDRHTAKNSFVEYVAKCVDVSQFTTKKAAEYDEVIFHLGSSTYHLRGIILALALPSTIILHDTDYEGAFRALLSEGYIAQSRFNAEEKLNGIYKYTKTEGFLASLVIRAKKIIVHSDFAKDIVNRTLGQGKKAVHSVVMAPLPIGISDGRADADKTSGTIIMAGIISPAKGLSRFLEIVADQRFVRNRFVLCGYDFALEKGYQKQIISDYPNLVVKTNLDKLSFMDELNKSTILFNFRDYYHGETSYATLEAMRAGVVPLVRKIGWFDELPSSSAIKADMTEDLAAKLNDVLKDKKQLDAMKDGAIKYANSHSPQEYIRAILG